ncbi:MAG: tetratricopeptide repeat protein [Spirochaetales bacterium]|nr:tetratricopeptide repeat protein [Spirochaetales bacterium]
MNKMTGDEIIIRISNAMKIGEWEQAGKLLNSLINQGFKQSKLYILLGIVYMKTLHFDKAETALKQAISIDPENIEAYNNLSLVYKQTANFDEAIEQIKIAKNLSLNRADILYNLANLYKDTGKPDLAIKEYQLAITKDPSFVLSYTNLGRVYEQHGKLELAKKTYKKGLETDFNNPRLHYNLGILYQHQGDFESAKKEFLQAIRVKPGWIDAMNNLGVVLSKLNENKKSIQFFNEVLKIDPQNIKALNNLGAEYSRKNEYALAQQMYEKALQINPDYKKASLNLGILWEEQGLYTESLKELHACLKKNPQDTEILYQIAEVYSDKGQITKAIKILEKILIIDQNHSDALRVLSSLYLKLGKYGLANMYYKQLMASSPQEKTIHLDFAQIWNDKKEFKKSEDEIHHFLSQNPSDIKAKLLLGELYLTQDETKKAEEIFNEIIETKPDQINAYKHLNEIYQKNNQKEKAVSLLNQYLEYQSQNNSDINIDKFNQSLELYEKAAKAYEKDMAQELHHKIFKHQYFIDDEEPINFPQKDMDQNSILNMGAQKSNIKIIEEEEILIIDEEIVDEEEIIELKDTEPSHLLDLLKNQDLYNDINQLKALKASEKANQSLSHSENKIQKKPDTLSDETDQKNTNEIKKQLMKKADHGAEITPENNPQNDYSSPAPHATPKIVKTKRIKKRQANPNTSDFELSPYLQNAIDSQNQVISKLKQSLKELRDTAQISQQSITPVFPQIQTQPSIFLPPKQIHQMAENPVNQSINNNKVQQINANNKNTLPHKKQTDKLKTPPEADTKKIEEKPNIRSELKNYLMKVKKNLELKNLSIPKEKEKKIRIKKLIDEIYNSPALSLNDNKLLDENKSIAVKPLVKSNKANTPTETRRKPIKTKHFEAESDTLSSAEWQGLFDTAKQKQPRKKGLFTMKMALGTLQLFKGILNFIPANSLKEKVENKINTLMRLLQN